ncbi:MAG: right-handed parallel beta-helix repeat-containing protein, partial [Promethearchaeota archaeon]
MPKKRFIILCLMVGLFLSYNFTLITHHTQNKLIIQKKASIKSSGYWVLTSIVIDNTGGGNYTWAEAEAEDWCSGNGTLSNPFVIENVTIDATSGSALLIRNSDVYFRIENCTLFNSVNAGIELNNVSNSQIIGNNCSNNNFGISLDQSINNEISTNFIINNSQYGILLNLANNNLIF